MLPVARVDAFGRVAEEEIDPAAQSRRCRERRANHLLSRAGIDRAFQDHDCSRRHRAADRPAGGAHRRQIGDLVAIDRGRDGDDVDVMADQERAVGGKLQRRRAERVGGDLPGAIVAGAQLADSLRIMIVAGHRAMPGERHGERQANVTQAHHGDLGRAQSLSPGRPGPQMTCTSSRLWRATAARAASSTALARWRNVPYRRAYRIARS